jgi:2-polyprenyl-3-methyl-5-hydroxy-6-metoxy-1,4-benzoquinol methylase
MLGAEAEHLLGFPPVKTSPVQAADVGAGTGICSLVFAALVCRVTAVDLSKEMLEVLQAKAQSVGSEANAVVADLGEFARHRQSTFDLVVGRGILHHIMHYQQAVRDCCRLVRKPGVVWFPSEPAERHGRRRPALSRAVATLDVALNALRKATRRNTRRYCIARKTSRWGKRTAEAERLAEVHAPCAMSLEVVRSTLRENGFEEAWTRWRPEARFRATIWLSKMLRLPETIFSVTAVRR